MNTYCHLIVACTAIALCGCPSAYQRCKTTHLFTSYTDYKVAPTFTTVSGIEVDLSGQKISVDSIDAMVDEVEQCLIRTFGNPAIIPDEVWHAGSCQNKTFPLPIARKCLVVKIADDWFVGKSGDQLLPHGTGGQCLDKGFVGPCFFRAVIQNNLTIVVPPEMKLFKDPLVKIATGCHMPWHSPPLAACITVPAKPAVVSLD